jgi:dolichol-phosphate mannosyltransferase
MSMPVTPPNPKPVKDQPNQTHNDLAETMRAQAAERGWQVPTFNLSVYRETPKPTCIIIPVINEGKRIHSLLSRMKGLGQMEAYDVIVADGGSSDGSLTPEAIAPYGLAALLTKTGPGKLSSQLRCAYAFALLHGYTHIVTIDGNDKDDPVSTPAFIEKLEQGFDFVQASRFITGGMAENTPFSRWLAIRLLHAPILSISSGFHWTDTTQGYRAYSSKMLSDSRIGIFRDVMRDYELLAYLSYRAPKLGFRCIELPTSRRYPAGEAAPTKITGIRGNLGLLSTLIATSRGKFNP